MYEGYKLIITKETNNGIRKSMAVFYQLRSECLIAVEEDFKRYQKESDVVELRLFRFDQQSMKELRRYKK